MRTARPSPTASSTFPSSAAALAAALATALAALLLVAPGPALAQTQTTEQAAAPSPWSTDIPEGFLSTSPRPEGAAPVLEERRALPPSCPGFPFVYSVSYPQRLDAGGPADLAVQTRARAMLDAAGRDAEDYVKEDYPCDAEMESETRWTSSPYKASGKALSVLYVMYSMAAGAAHPNMTYASQNLLADGTEITLGRLFPDAAKSLPLLWKTVFEGYCKLGQDTAPSIYGSGECKAGPGDLPDPLKDPAGTLDAAGHMVLTSKGLTVNLDAYEAYFHAFGPQSLDIPKDALTAMGADPSLW
jgi:hypothetical protein